MLRTDTRLELQETEVTYQVSVVTVSKAHCIQACKGSYSHTAGCTRNANRKLQTPKRITYKKDNMGAGILDKAKSISTRQIPCVSNCDLTPL